MVQRIPCTFFMGTSIGGMVTRITAINSTLYISHTHMFHVLPCGSAPAAVLLLLLLLAVLQRFDSYQST